MGKRKRVPDTKKGHDSPSKSKLLKLEKSTSASGGAGTSKTTPGSEWKLWGPYLSERQWGTVREDLSEDGSCWESFPHSDAASRAYVYGEDGLFGWSDDQAQLCMALALWNGKDPILKERLYGLTGPQGNHGEDVKECYYYLDGTASHSYMKALYKYPIQEYPYQQILAENTNRTSQDPEYELIDTGIFDNSEYFDVYCEYIKPSPREVLCQYTVHNRSNKPAQIDVLPQVWFRNTWSDGQCEKPKIQALGDTGVLCIHSKLGKYIFEYQDCGEPTKLFTENETNLKLVDKDIKRKLQQQQPHVVGKTQHGYKDAFHQYVVHGNITALNSSSRGTKFGVQYHLSIPVGGSSVVKCRLVYEPEAKPIDFGKAFDRVVERARSETHTLYKQMLPSGLSAAELSVATQAYAGLCWNKQYFGYDLTRWMNTGSRVINQHWKHMVNSDIISMPDKWEFPWYATWDLAFHMIPYTDIDTDFVKEQLLLFLNHRYMHPNGQLPAYEFDFSDVNPPVHAMACLHVYRKCKDATFLKKAFNKLLINFNWWLNNKQIGQTFLFGGGFLGMDNESCLHRSQLPAGCTLYQVDGTCWMAYYSLCMMQIALELCFTEEAYIDMVVMYLDYFLSMSYAVNFGLDGNGLWDEIDGFFYDLLETEDDDKNHKTKRQLLRVRAMIGLSTLFPACIIPEEMFGQIDGLQARVKELMDLRKKSVSKLELEWSGEGGLFLSALPRGRLERILRYLCDQREFYSPYGIRSLSKFHKDHPFSVVVGGEVHSVEYNPGESQCDMFGGNSNWRGPIWFPMNYLLVESLETLGRHYGDKLTVPVTTRLERPLSSNLCDFAGQICQRLVLLFMSSSRGYRPCHGGQALYQSDPHFKDLILFYEYFDGDTGRGCGANHQTGWTALVVTLLRKLKEKDEKQHKIEMK